MGFATGFTGGVTVTLSIACLSVLAHQRNRLAQAEALRSQAYLLDTLSTPQGAPGARRAAAARASLAERAKDRWNHEVSNAAGWVQGASGPAAAADRVEDAVGRAWSRALGGSVEQAEAVLPAAGGTVEAATGADASRVTVASIVGKARTAVGVAQEKIEAAVATVSAATAAAPPPGVSPVERALQQRYESRDEVFAKSAAEIINERYRPIDERDNTTLRGL
ncbi:hypothetical protein GGTG_12181 [Gaeumannomyces tritici R3-111a-1]|uniref:MICOS complex subunit MIC12 n=1 Tax=Gaeumannomyces tritici (strain R3-111a-1) TaxID=644352 RepID=J3PFA2_GAET3|nr:hypothetical protein GGTG_12181 [Gaeumannomyces tritici R3-111a-1]EJT70004.1 hypothetical protein GGTG_12181 [Gaeumannomyces tritici R3-111a-1]